MSQFICPSCGKETEPGKFCFLCGAPLANVVPPAAEPVAPQPENVVPQPEVVAPQTEPVESPTPSYYDVKPSATADPDAIPPLVTYRDEPTIPEPEEPVVKKPRRLHAPAGITVLSVFLCILAVVATIISGTLFFVRQYLEPSNIKGMVKRIDVTKIKYENEYLPDYVYDHLGRVIRDRVDVDDLTPLFELESVKKFVADKANEYIKDIISNSSDAEITDDEIIDLIDENWDDIVAELGLKKYDDLISVSSMKKQFNDVVKSGLKEVKLSKFSMEEIRENDTINSVLKWVSIALSYVTIIGLLVFAIVMFVLIFVLNIKYAGGFKYLGVSAVIASIPFFAITIFAGKLPALLVKNVNLGEIKLGEAFFKTFCSPLSSNGLTDGLILLGIGVVSIVIGVVARTIYKKKVKAALANQ